MLVKRLAMNSKSVRWAFDFSKWNPSRSDMLLASSCIQTEEKQRLERFVFKKDVKSSLVGMLMLRKFVCETSNKQYDEITFLRDAKGKPVLHPDFGEPRLNFNVSHHGNYTVCVGECGDIMLGVDVMKLEYTGGKSLSEFFRIMSRQFAPNEWVNIKGAGDEREQTAMFCRHWCLKESYVKAIGIGITTNLQDIQFKVNTKSLSQDAIVNDTELFVKGEKLKWKFEEMLVDAEHCVSVAMNHDLSGGLFEEIAFEQLIENCVPLAEADEMFSENYFKKLDKA